MRSLRGCSSRVKDPLVSLRVSLGRLRGLVAGGLRSLGSSSSSPRDLSNSLRAPVDAARLLRDSSSSLLDIWVCRGRLAVRVPLSSCRALSNRNRSRASLRVRISRDLKASLKAAAGCHSSLSPTGPTALLPASSPGLDRNRVITSRRRRAPRAPCRAKVPLSSGPNRQTSTSSRRPSGLRARRFIRSRESPLRAGARPLSRTRRGVASSHRRKPRLQTRPPAKGAASRIRMGPMTSRLPSLLFRSLRPRRLAMDLS